MASNSTLLTFLFLLLSPLLCHSSYHLLDVRSLLPSSGCSPVEEEGTARSHSGLKVTHRYGLCSPAAEQRPSLADLLRQDESRVSSLRRSGDYSTSDSASGPTRPGTALGSANFLVTIALGTPPVPQTVAFDTGTDFTWVQRLDGSNLYPQQDPLFNPFGSSTNSRVPCAGDPCALLPGSTGSPAGCDKTDCTYTVKYNDGSRSYGQFVRDGLQLGSTTVLADFMFGCGVDNAGNFGRVAGILGLGRGRLSLVTQTAQRYKGGAFSYCLPSSDSAAGFLNFGDAATASPAGVQYTAMLLNPNFPSLYFLDLTSISVAGEILPIPPTAFSAGGTLIDSGTVVSRLPLEAYSAVQAAVKAKMAKYPAAPPMSVLDTCFNLTGFQTVEAPAIEFVFKGGAKVRVDGSGMFVAASIQQVCLAIAGNKNGGDVGIIGNMQQKRHAVVYDTQNNQIGFGANACG